jgi:hypothetical protein
MYRGSTKKAMLYSREIAEEDAKVAAAILEEDLKQDDVLASTSSSEPSVSSSVMASAWSLAPPMPMDYLGYYCLALQLYIENCNSSTGSLLPIICNATE